MTNVPPPPPKGLPKAPPINNGKTSEVKIPTLGKLKPIFAPPRIILNAVEGWGKTSMAAYMEEPAILMARGETGYETLLGSGLVPSVDAARVDDWPGLLGLLENVGNHKSVILDALGGFERLCHEHVCNRDFNGDWGERGFASFQKGYDVSVAEWLKLLAILDHLRDSGIIVALLSHCRIKTFKNPLGADYDRYGSEVHDKTWSVTHRWSDAALFGKFFSSVETSKSNKPDVLKKGKGIGGNDRVIYTEWQAGFDAKNRYNMPPVIDIPNDPKLIWSTIREAIYNGKDK
jgi:hypothetical protein